jgi:hypothetical protein
VKRPGEGLRGRRLLLFAAVPLGAGVLALAAVLASPLGTDLLGGGGGDDGVLRAGIVDQLSLTAPNPEFRQEATRMLENDGYTVEYVSGEDVTVDLYRSLPERDYDLLILRVHSTAEVSRGEEDVTAISLFTGEPYSRDLYYDEQLDGRVGFAQYTEESPKLFGVTSRFVRNSMKGKFDDTLVLMMGCQGFLNAEGAEAFEARGARAFIGWDGLVSATHTDEATQTLLRYLIVQDQEPADAIARTMTDVGPDPDYNSQLVSRP